MKKFEEIKFNIGELKGISAKNIEEHLKLYAGYVKNANFVFDKIGELSVDEEKNIYVLGELHRRFSFEYNGMRNHEVYFSSLSGGAKSLQADSIFKKIIEEQHGSFEAWLASFKNLAMTRGIGWAVLWYDKKDKRLLASWIDEQHIGELNGCEMILALDMWEHAYLYDYASSEKKKYIEAFFENLNWEVVEENLKKVL
ncbi:superoxide dismutase [Candidatus Nomurabacteria bacterium]|nr:superoxide dismutase [Candidatus Nomurabacteria bacterium]